MQRITVRHRTTYTYCEPVTFGEHRLMVRPRDSHDLRVIDATIAVEPRAQLRWLHDVFGNSVTIATFDQPSDRLQIESNITIDRYPLSDIDFPIETFARQLPFSYPASEMPDLVRNIERQYPDPKRQIIEWTRRWISEAGSPPDTEAFLRLLTAAIKDGFEYIERYEPGVQSPVDTLTIRSGTCRDFAVLMMEALRNVGLAARFVSGYLYDPAVNGGAADIVGGGSTHAWVQVYLPGAGWIEFDPTNGTLGGHNLVPVAVARTPEQAIPISGTYEGDPQAYQGMEVEVMVRSVQVGDVAL